MVRHSLEWFEHYNGSISGTHSGRPNVRKLIFVVVVAQKEEKRREEKRREGVETIQRKRQNLSGSRYPIVH